MISLEKSIILNKFEYAFLNDNINLCFLSNKDENPIFTEYSMDSRGKLKTLLTC